MKHEIREIPKPDRYDNSKGIAIYEGTYHVYSTGEIFSLRKNRFLKEHVAKSGYITTTFFNETTYVHRIVATCFVLNPDPLTHTSVNHRDGNKANNKHMNLDWVTHKQNMQHANVTGLMKPTSGESNPNAKLTELHVSAIRCLLGNGNFTHYDISTLFGISQTNISHIKSGKRWKF